MLEFLQEDGLFPQQVVLELFGDAGVGDVGDGEEEPDVVLVEIFELAGGDDQTARLLPLANKVHFIGIDLGAPG